MAQKFKTNILLLSGQNVVDIFYPKSSNPSGYVTSSQTGQFSVNKTGFYIFPVQSIKLPSGSPCRIDASELNWRVLFDASTNQSGLWQFNMPPDYINNPQLRLTFSLNQTQAGTNNVIWNSYVSAITPNSDSVDVVTGNFIVNSGTHTLDNNQTAGWPRQIVIPLSNNNSVQANDFVEVILQRDAVNDTATSDVELISTTLEYQ